MNGATQTSGRRPPSARRTPASTTSGLNEVRRDLHARHEIARRDDLAVEDREDLEWIDPVEPLQVGDADVDHPGHRGDQIDPALRRSPHHQPGSADSPRQADGGLVLVKFARLGRRGPSAVRRGQPRRPPEGRARQPPALRPALAPDRHVPGEDRTREPGRRPPARNDPLDLHAVRSAVWSALWRKTGGRSGSQPLERSLDRPPRVDGGHRRPVLAIGMDVVGDLDPFGRMGGSRRDGRRRAVRAGQGGLDARARGTRGRRRPPARCSRSRCPRRRLRRRPLRHRRAHSPTPAAPATRTPTRRHRAGRAAGSRSGSRSSARSVWNGPSKNPSIGIDPLTARTSGATISASRASRQAGRSEAGSAWAIAPPIVPRLRTCRSPMFGSASCSRP